MPGIAPLWGHHVGPPKCHTLEPNTHSFYAAVCTSVVQCLREAVGLMYNATGAVPCYKLDLSGPAAGNSGAWDWQWCSQMMAQELPYYPATGRTDMFWDQVGIGELSRGACQQGVFGHAW